jgi:hypothetical protein
LPAGWFASWLAHVLMVIGLPKPKPKPPVDPPSPSPILADIDGQATLKGFSQTALRDLSAALAKAGRYEDVATVAKVAREWGDK